MAAAQTYKHRHTAHLVSTVHLRRGNGPPTCRQETGEPSALVSSVAEQRRGTRRWTVREGEGKTVRRLLGIGNKYVSCLFWEPRFLSLSQPCTQQLIYRPIRRYTWISLCLSEKQSSGGHSRTPALLQCILTLRSSEDLSQQLYFGISRHIFNSHTARPVR